LVAKSHLLHDGRQLRIDIPFIYKEMIQKVTVRTQQTTRGRAGLLEEQEAAYFGSY